VENVNVKLLTLLSGTLVVETAIEPEPELTASVKVVSASNSPVEEFAAMR
jgi:hypothetical protein